jgi:hypothetical protein
MGFCLGFGTKAAVRPTLSFYTALSTGARAARMIRTGRFAWFATPFETLPRSAEVTAPRPREPTTIKSALLASATATISSIVSPEMRSSAYETPAFSAASAASLRAVSDSSISTWCGLC